MPPLLYYCFTLLTPSFCFYCFATIIFIFPRSFRPGYSGRLLAPLLLCRIHYSRNRRICLLSSLNFIYRSNVIAKIIIALCRENFSCHIRHFCLSYKIVFICSEQFFVTKFVTRITKFVTCISNFVMAVTKFVTKTFCADRKKYQGGSKNFQGERKKYLRERGKLLVR